MSTAKRMLSGAIGLVLVIAFCFLVVNIYRKGDTTIGNSVSQYDSLVSQYGDSLYGRYENGSASGSEILSLLENLTSEDGISITVYNGSNTATVYTYSNINAANSTMMKNARTKSNTEAYINPTASFTSAVSKDANGVIGGITFRQK